MHLASPWLLFVEEEGRALQAADVSHANFESHLIQVSYLGAERVATWYPVQKTEDKDGSSQNEGRMGIGIHCEISSLEVTQGTVWFSLWSFIIHALLWSLSRGRIGQKQ